jgi:hypothetical protein
MLRKEAVLGSTGVSEDLRLIKLPEIPVGETQRYVYSI